MKTILMVAWQAWPGDADAVLLESGRRQARKFATIHPSGGDRQDARDGQGHQEGRGL